MQSLNAAHYRSKMQELGRVRRRKITIQKMTVFTDEWKNQRKDWRDWKEIWAKRSSLWGQTYYAAKVAGEENTVEFEIMYVAFMKDLVDNVNQYRVVFDSVPYEIKQVDFLKDDDGWIKLRCLESGRDG